MRRRILGTLLTIILAVLFSACESNWQTLGTVEDVGWSRGASMVYLTDGSGYLVSNDMIDEDCKKGAKLKAAGFLYSCY